MLHAHDDVPGHTAPVGCRVKTYAPTDYALRTNTTRMLLHGNVEDLTRLVHAIGAVWPPRFISELIDCQPAFACFHVDLLVAGRPNRRRLDQVLAPIANPSTYQTFDATE